MSSSSSSSSSKGVPGRGASSALLLITSILFFTKNIAECFNALPTKSILGQQNSARTTNRHDHYNSILYSAKTTINSDQNNNNKNNNNSHNDCNKHLQKNPMTNISTRRNWLSTSTIITTFSLLLPTSASAKCTDIESCREIGERKVEDDMKANPTTSLPSGVRYKIIRPGTGDDVVVKEDSTVDLIYSINTASGAYMYSKGFGFEKIDLGDGIKQSDLGLDSLRTTLGFSNEKREIPLGIEQALVGMKRGERRRVELPPSVGFETSEWRPEPTTRRGKASIVGYRQILEGRGSNQPPFPAVTIWDVEVLGIRK